MTSSGLELFIRCFRISDGLNTITRCEEIDASVPVFRLRPLRRSFSSFVVTALFPCNFKNPRLIGKCASSHANARLIHASVYKNAVIRNWHCFVGGKCLPCIRSLQRESKDRPRFAECYGTSLARMSAVAHLADLQSQFQYVAKVPSPASAYRTMLKGIDWTDQPRWCTFWRPYTGVGMPSIRALSWSERN
jgi:hypothetical protein